jgi:hypothetical protein
MLAEAGRDWPQWETASFLKDFAGFSGFLKEWRSD